MIGFFKYDLSMRLQNSRRVMFILSKDMWIHFRRSFYIECTFTSVNAIITYIYAT